MQNKKARIIYMGTPEFAVPALLSLHERYTVIAVVTVPDKDQGRGRKPQPSAVKLKADELSIPVLQPEKLRDEIFIRQVKELNPDIIAVIAFRILPKEIYEIPAIASFNIHGSLLPAYRGAAPINWAIINGEKKSGLTSFILEQKVDTGSLIAKKEVEINEDYTAGDLHDLLMPLSAELAVETVEVLLSGSRGFMLQDESLASPAPKIFPEGCKIDFTKEAGALKNFIHGVSPIPGAWCLWGENRLKIFRTGISDVAPQNMTKPGDYVIGSEAFLIRCSDYCLNIGELQIQGGKKMNATDFIRGYRGESQGSLK